MAPRTAPSTRLAVFLLALPLTVGCRSTFPQVARQVTADSLTALACRPLHSGASLASNTGDAVWASASGVARKRVALSLHTDPPPLSPECAPVDGAALEADLRRLTGRDLKPVHLDLQTDGASSLAALHTLIDGACQRLDVLMFLWEDDAIGRGIAERLAARARAGVAVRVLVDGSGNLIYGNPESGRPDAVVDWLRRQPGVALYRVPNPFGRFDHRKLVVADGGRAWSGGRNFTRPSFLDYSDATYVASGPLAADMAAEFETSWRERGGSPSSPLAISHDWGEANAHARLVTTRPPRHDFRDVVLRAVEQARHHVYLENPLLCDPRLVVRLAEARRRGVDVRVVLTLEPGAPVVGAANRVTANRLLRAGVRVYLHPGVTHLKALTVDSVWAYLGTGNFDGLSFRNDAELGIAVGAGPLPRAWEERLLLPHFRPEWELREPLPLEWWDRLAELLASFLF